MKTEREREREGGREGKRGREKVEWSSQQGGCMGRRYLHYRVLVVLVLWVTAEQHGRAVLAIGYETVFSFYCWTDRERSNNRNL
jgi:hypothetical protein